MGNITVSLATKKGRHNRFKSRYQFILKSFNLNQAAFPYLKGILMFLFL